MNILHICSYYENVLFENLVKALDKQGINNEVFVFFPKEQARQNFERERTNVVLKFCYSKKDRCIFHLKHNKVVQCFTEEYHARINNFDVIYAHSLFSNGYVAYKAKKRWGIPYIVMVQNTDLNVFFKYMKHLHSLGINILKNASKIIFASQSYVDEALNKYIPAKTAEEIKEKISIVPYGIDDYYFENFGNKARDNRNKCILSVATICKNKNHILLAKAVDYLNKKSNTKNINLIIIGKFENSGIVSKLSQFDFVQCINFMPKEELIDYFASADLFTLVSKTETFGLVYAEALSQGCPIIYSKGQGFDQQFPEGLVGYHANSNNYRNVAQTIEKLMKSNISAEICQKSATRYRWDNISKTYYDLFCSIMQNK